MKKIRAKQLSLALALTLSLGIFAGCAGGSSSSESKQSSSSKVDSSSAAAVAGVEGFAPFEKQVEIQIPVYDRNVEGLPAVDDNYWTKWVQTQFGDKYNVKVTYVAIPRTDEVTKMNMLIASGDAPSIIFHYDYPAAVAYADQGALAEIDMEQFKQIAPTYYSNMESYKVLDYTKLNGKDTFIAAVRPLSYNWTTLIRQDWIDAVNMKMPTNYKEYTALLDAWLAAGLCDYPITKQLPTTGYVPENYLYRDFPVEESEMALYSDLTVASLSWKPTYEYLKRSNAEYNKGYYSKEYYLDTDGTQMKADFIAGKAGIYGNYLASDADYIKGLLENNPNAKVASINPYHAVDEGQVPAGREMWPFGLLIGFSSENSEDETKAAQMYLEWMAQPDNLFTLQNGVEGKTYTLDDKGLPVMQAYDGEERLNYGNNKDMYALVIEGRDYGSEEANLQVQINTYAPKGMEYLIEDNYKYTQDTKKYWQRDFLFPSSIASVTEYKATLLSKWQEDCVKLTICKPSEFEDLYTTLTDEYLKAGYQTILDERKSAYEAATK